VSKKKKNNDIIITFLGESRNDVTGSSVLINIPRKNGTRYNILIEMGLVQGANTIEQDLANNRKMLERFNKDLIHSIENVFICHEHCDHMGNLPYLTANGYEGNVIMPKECIFIVKDLLKDSVTIHQGNVQKLKQTKGKRTKEFYNLQSMYSIFDRFIGVNIGEKYRLNDEVEYRFINSGHVLGGAILELWITKPNNNKKHLIYTSDMGSKHNNEFQYFVSPREYIHKCNVLISEATYNNLDRSWKRKDAIEEREILKKELKEYLCNGKDILFSAFSFGRTQNLICMLYDFFYNEEWFKDIDIILDGVLIHKINNDYLKILKDEELEYFKKVLSWKNIKVNKTYDGTIAILSQKNRRKIVISTSGFLTTGRITSYLKHMVGSSNSVIYLTGYCGDKDSLGGQLLNPDVKVVKIEKSTIKKSAIIKRLKTFSSHIQFTELISLFKNVDCQSILVHHSSSEDKENFVEIVKEELSKVGKSTKVIAVTDKNYQFII